MNELLAGIAGGLGLFIVGMWILTENLKAMATRRLRRAAGRWTGNRFSALAWGALAGAITQSMTAKTFIVVGILRSGLVTTRGALALTLGGGVGVSALVVIATFDIKVVALYALGIAGAA
ncbi:MAG: Na/Pi cotransporter family protein, partial [Boseongicola sp. SB0664_bin_43]|nr:Na/Pi cotransporter family protein [Boseongicola sp. SB0664_bin_43]